MTDNYDTETMRAIIAEAKRQGFDDKIIALNLGIARDNPAFGYEGEDQLRASISEHLRRGIHREGIADRLSLSLGELVRIEGNPDLRIGIDGGLYCVYPFAAHAKKASFA
jgi:DNA gyrase inhibitor GyrI